jgi:hypothetical protein
MRGARVLYTTKVDVYSYGIMLCELLTWKIAFTELESSSEGDGEHTPALRSPMPMPVRALSSPAVCLLTPFRSIRDSQW